MSELKKRIKHISERIIRNNRFMYEEIGKMASLQIAKRTRLGKGLSGKLAALKPSTIKSRKRKSLHSETRATKSNLTETGQMIDSITYKTTGNGASINFSNSDASQKATWAHDGSSNRPKREFFGVTDLEKKSIQRWLKEYLVSEIKKRL